MLWKHAGGWVCFIIFCSIWILLTGLKGVTEIQSMSPFTISSCAEVVTSVTLHTHMWGLIPSWCIWNAWIYSSLLSGLLRKRSKETELSFVRVLPRTTHQSPGILAHNTLISWHFGTSTTHSRNVVGTWLLRCITLQAFNFVYVFAKLHQSVPCTSERSSNIACISIELQS